MDPSSRSTTRLRKAALAALLLALAPPLAASFAAPHAGAALRRPELAVDSGRARRLFALDAAGRSAATTRFEAGGTTIALGSREFRFLLDDGSEVVAGTLPLERLAALPAELGKRGVLLRFAAPDSPFAVTVAYGADGNAPWLTKQVRLSTRDAARAARLLAEVEVEQFTLASGRFEGGGEGQPAQADHGLFVALDHPLGECVVEGARVTLRERPLRAALPAADGWHDWPWSSLATIGAGDERSGDSAGLARWLAQRTPNAPPQPLFAVAASELAASDAELLAALAPRGAPAKALFGATARPLALLSIDAFARDRWFAPAATLPAGALGRAVAALAESDTPLALTVPLAQADGTPLPLAGDAELRAARKALVALLQHEKKVRAPAWIVHELPSAWPTDAAARAALVNGWSELFATERKLCPNARLALLAPHGSRPSPFWSRFVDLVVEPPAPLDVSGSVAEAAARAAAGRERGAAWLALPAADAASAEQLAALAAGFEFWRNAPREGDAAPLHFANESWRPRTIELPARPHGWLRLHPFAQWHEAHGAEPTRVELAAGETALFVPLAAPDAGAPFLLLPRAIRFDFAARDATPATFAMPGSRFEVEWFDRAARRSVARTTLGSAPAFQRRPADAARGATVTELWRTARGARIAVTFASPCFRNERLALRVETAPASALAIEGLVTTPVGAVARSLAPAAGRLEFVLAESREPVTLAFELVGDFDAAATLLLAVQLVETQERLPLPPPRALDAAPLACPAAAERLATWVLHDGPLPPRADAAVEQLGYGQ
ncbi:MAG: hypothetical protein JNL90_04480 [Planctomycetes bacterium]|nr:hypothetical protein [Planctomycetota bacterium]